MECLYHDEECWARVGQLLPDRLRSAIGKVVKYSGSKDELFAPIETLITQERTQPVHGRFLDPFTGSASVTLYLTKKGHLDGQATLADLNPDVVDLHRIVRDHVADLIEVLVRLEEEYNRLPSDKDRETLYYKVRGDFNHTKAQAGQGGVERVAQFLFLLRAGYNGVIRYNSQRDYNIAWAKRREFTFFTAATPRDTFLATSQVLQDPGVELRRGDFEETVRAAHPGPEDFVYLDPPYFNTMSATPGHYTPRGFPVEDQLRLKRLVDELTGMGVPVLEDNNDDPFIRELYDGYDIFSVTATEKVTQDPTQRGKRNEVLISNRSHLGRPPPPSVAQGTLEDYLSTQ